MQPHFDSHVWECARVWISQYGSDAHAQALKRAHEFEANGASGTAWRRVAEAIGYLQSAAS
jgi:hypothetical protein